jgi:hypothetical protein
MRQCWSDCMMVQPGEASSKRNRHPAAVYFGLPSQEYCQASDTL